MNQHPYILDNPPIKEPVSGTKTYNVSLQTKIEGIEKTINSTIDYTFEITYTNHFFTLKKTNVTIDKKSIPSKINELYLKTMSPLDVVEFRCTEQGKVKKIYHHHQILKKWEETKHIITQEFVGTPVNEIITQLDKVYHNKKMLIERLNTNLILQVFYRSFLNSYLIYYGQSNSTFINTGILGSTPLPFKSKRKMGLKEEQLHLQMDAQIDKSNIDSGLLGIYFENQEKSFNLDDLKVNIKDDTLLEYKGIWINQSTVNIITELNDYKKEIIITLQSI